MCCCCRDVGVYVAITSLEPLLAYVFTGGVLLRFCSQEYVRDITPDTPSNTYVIYGLDDYTPASNSAFLSSRVLLIGLQHVRVCRHASGVCARPQVVPLGSSQAYACLDLLHLAVFAFSSMPLPCSGGHAGPLCRRWQRHGIRHHNDAGGSEELLGQSRR